MFDAVEHGLDQHVQDVDRVVLRSCLQQVSKRQQSRDPSLLRHARNRLGPRGRSVASQNLDPTRRQAGEIEAARADGAYFVDSAQRIYQRRRTGAHRCCPQPVERGLTPADGYDEQLLETLAHVSIR